MKKLNIFTMAFLIGLICYITSIYAVILGINFLTSCQTKTNPDCTITYKADTNKFTVPCKDSIFYSEFEIESINP